GERSHLDRLRTHLSDPRACSPEYRQYPGQSVHAHPPCVRESLPRLSISRQHGLLVSGRPFRLAQAVGSGPPSQVALKLTPSLAGPMAPTATATRGPVPPFRLASERNMKH